MEPDVENALKLIKSRLAKKYNLKKTPSNIELLNYLSVKPKEIITKPTRTISGVAPIAIMTKPHKCPHIKKGIGPCLMCPGGMNSYFGNVPQSYTGKEPATMRAIRNKYDPYLQVFNRLEQYTLLNQNFDKIEIIIMGGTFPSTPIKYQEEFTTYIFKALNDFSELFFVKGKFNFIKFKNFFELPGNIKDKNRVKNIHKKLLKLKKKSNLLKEQLRNEKAKIRCVALCIETRPDYCNKKEIDEMLKLGCTRVELGVQTIYDDVLTKINRGHSVKETIEATKLLRDSFLKVGYHMIPGLPYSNKEKDIEMFKELFENENFKPDALKIYPCMVLKGTKLYDLWKENKYIPLTTKNAVDLIVKIKKYIPSYCRVMRTQRDIPSYAIESGVDKTNLRQYVQEEMKKQNVKCNCIRCRELKNQNVNLKNLKIIKRQYNASNGKEIFISAESDNILLGFCRLRIPSNPYRKEISKNSAGIRELHVYGKSLELKEKNENSVQHQGIGKQLLKEAEKLAKIKKIKKMFIISGVGVKEYYKKLGYKKDGCYMSKSI
ncbi:MAG: tRNA uridine(34) 5-carboxymethylaminomethyl modification radical SAM/GNAT enzyme Elp3 [Candidatus Nanoarchaeia archaeon]|nr:tRNA uridine(34) 5-carboxymethylaminomethyl modification radical SAM/GNAT enzyme Elp3 [Candidatus Nanoarchaeia archaeon]